MTRRPFLFSLLAAASVSSTTAMAADPWITFEGVDGPGKGKHVVLISGDEEYRSEEAMPMMARLLSEKHGFKTTVLFSVDAEGKVDPNNQQSLTNPAALDSADAVILMVRFRGWPDDAMGHFANFFKAGKPIIALRTSTHAFSLPKESAYAKYTWNGGGEWKGGFGEQVLGETWISHWGNHMKEATRGVIEPSAKDNPVLRGIESVFGDTDVYEAHPPKDATILLRGTVLKGMHPADGPAVYSKKTAAGVEQDVNTPAMPVAWTREYKNETGATNRILTTTMGSATDLADEALRRLLINGVYWGLKMDVPAKADAALSWTYKPSDYKGNGFKKGLTPAEFAPAK